jgi:hypothetical protein
MEKVTKSGSSVNICSCSSSDYCNFKLWPNQHNDFDNDDGLIPDDGSSSSTNFRRQVPVSSSYLHEFSLIYLSIASLIGALAVVGFPAL